MAESFTRKEAALALLNHPAPKLTKKAGQFLGQMVAFDVPLTDAQLDWLNALLKRVDLPSCSGER